ncbi:MAG: serine hydrolase [Euryarchaeota archaeon]|nr:serine hydrolase [Euryarchaeota archaeon]
MEPQLKDAFRKIDLFVHQDLRASGVPALVVGITNRERLLHVFAHGYANLDRKIPIRPDSRFEIGSISKSFASIVLLQLQERGLLDLDDPVTECLPWLKIKTRFKPITLRHLMSHTAGITLGADESLSAYSEALVLEKIGASTPPGRFFHYSNTGYKILGLVLEELLGKSNGQIIKERVTEPLGMKDTETVIWNDIRERLPVGYSAYYDDRPLPRNGRLAPSPWFESETADGSIVSTASDMATYVRMILNKGRGPERRIISQKSFEMLTQKIVDSSDANSKEYYGLGLGTRTVNDHTYVGHRGGMLGFISEILADIDDGLGVVTLNNSHVDSNNIAVNTLTMLNAAVRGKRLPSLPAPRDPFHVKNASDYTSDYGRLHGGRVSFRSQRDRLYLVEGNKTIPLEQRDKDTFLADHPDYRLFLLKFGRKAGKVVEVFHGADWYPKDPYKGRRVLSHPRPWEPYTGHYRSHNPWNSNFRVVLRKGALVLIQHDGKEEPIVALEDGTFRVGADKRCPERIEFSTIFKGKAMAAVLSGGRYVRVSSP